VTVDPDVSKRALLACATEVDERLKRFAKLNLKAIDTYNNAVRNAQRQGVGFKRKVQTGFDPSTGHMVFESETIVSEPMPRLIIAIDDVDILILGGDPELPRVLERLCRLGRAAGVHVIATTTSLDPDRLPHSVKSGFEARIALKLASKADSRAMIGQGGAERLLGAGDLLFRTSGEPLRAQGPWFSPEDAIRVSADVRTYGLPRYWLT
jgi:S-DNA-T family DNA segregation ATPase FtsK/SpoIIIE